MIQKTGLKKIIVANWKMNPMTEREAILLAKATDNVSVILCVPFPYIGSVKKVIKKAKLGAQNISTDVSGAVTGQVSASMLASMGVKYTIVGHCECRARKETNEMVAQKILRALKAKMIPIVCVGEKMRDGSGSYLHEVRDQLTASLAGVPKSALHDIIIAYEPIWAIGEGTTRFPSTDEICEMTLYIKKILAEIAQSKSLLKTKVLYGGSVDPKTISGILAAPVDGLLVGRASLVPKKFNDITKACAALK